MPADDEPSLILEQPLYFVQSWITFSVDYDPGKPVAQPNKETNVKPIQTQDKPIKKDTLGKEYKSSK